MEIFKTELTRLGALWEYKVFRDQSNKVTQRYYKNGKQFCGSRVPSGILVQFSFELANQFSKTQNDLAWWTYR